MMTKERMAKIPIMIPNAAPFIRPPTLVRTAPRTRLTTLRPGVQRNLRKPRNLAAVAEKIHIPN